MGRMRTKVVGVTFENEDGSSRQENLRNLDKLDKLSLRDDSSDKYPEAIGVYTKSGKQIGYLSKGVAQSLRDAGMDTYEIEEAEAWVKSVGRPRDEPGAPLGCWIYIRHELVDDDWDDEDEYEEDERNEEMEQIQANLRSIDIRMKEAESEYRLASARASSYESKKKESPSGCLIVFLVVLGGAFLTVMYMLYNWIGSFLG